jgi:hypothetical protein
MISVDGYTNRIFFNHTATVSTLQDVQEMTHMPTTKEFTVRLGDWPGTLGKVCRALTDHKVNIVAFQSVPLEGKSLVRFVVDHPEASREALDNEGLSYIETEVAQVRLAHRPGELARAASRLADADININYAYCGVDPRTNIPLIIFGVAEAEHASMILERSAAAA